jgi:hypothetical protein
MIPIEFYVKFNLTGRVKPNSERKKEKTESMFFSGIPSEPVHPAFLSETKTLSKSDTWVCPLCISGWNDQRISRKALSQKELNHLGE